MSLELLKRTIQHYGLKGTPEEIANALNAKTEIIVNNELYTVAGIIQELGVAAARTLIAKFKAVAENDALLSAVYDKLVSTGISFSDPTTLGMLSQLHDAGVFTAEEVEALRSIGIKKKSKWELVIGDGATVDASTVAAALNDNPAISRNVLISVNRNEQATRVSIVIQNLANGYPDGSQSVYDWQSGSPLPDDPVIANVIRMVNEAASLIEV